MMINHSTATLGYHVTNFHTFYKWTNQNPNHLLVLWPLYARYLCSRDALGQSCIQDTISYARYLCSSKGILHTIGYLVYNSDPNSYEKFDLIPYSYMVMSRVKVIFADINLSGKYLTLHFLLGIGLHPKRKCKIGLGQVRTLLLPREDS